LELKQLIYLDNAATTRPIINVDGFYREYAQNSWYNPSAMYKQAVEVERKLNDARKTLALPISAIPEYTLFTSGGTESANAAILRGFHLNGGKKQHFIVSAYEHAAVYASFQALQNMGHSVSYLSPEQDGHISEESLCSLVNEDTALVSIMHVNNETGSVNDIERLSAAVKRINKNTLFHSDGVQGYLRCPFHFQASSADYYTVSAHKVHGLKGTGAVFFKKNTPLKSLIYGGSQERGLRAGTENTFGILFFGEAVKEYTKDLEQKLEHIKTLNLSLKQKLLRLDGAYLLSPSENCAPHILNIAFEGIRAEVLLHLLEQKDIAVSTGAACSSKKKREDRIHKHLGFGTNILEGALRFSFSFENTLDEVDTVSNEVAYALTNFRKYVRR
jgi:cysteine desulfurase